MREIDVQLLDECINFEIRIGGKLCRFLCLYRSPSQTRDIFETFVDNFELTLDSIIELKIDTITSQFGLQKTIIEPTCLTSNSPSCIDLMFTSQANLVMESCFQSSLHPICHHQIVFAKINLKIYYPLPYEREIWHYEKANTDLIGRSIDQFPWDIGFAHTDVNQKVYLFN